MEHLSKTPLIEKHSSKKETIKKYTVKELNDKIASTLKNKFSKIIVCGEVSGLKNYGGNLYFTLKDDNACINAVLWKSYTSSMKDNNLTDGIKIQAEVKIDLFAKLGKLQLIVISFKKEGLGEIHERYLELKEKYQKKGYFDIINKKTIPKLIKSIGIITSEEGAALQDILSVLKKHNFKGNVYTKHCAVQGVKCAESISTGINFFQEFHNPTNKDLMIEREKVDLILIARGGGSFEDLIGFSDEKVLKAIYKSKIYTISAIGHEIDFMLSDFVADYRAATPSVAAEFIAEHNQKYWRNKLTKVLKNEPEYKKEIFNKIFLNSKAINNFRNVDLMNSIHSKFIELDNNWKNYKTSLNKNINLFIREFNKANSNLEAANPEKLLRSGLAKISGAAGENIQTKKELAKYLSTENKKIKISFNDGSIILITKESIES